MRLILKYVMLTQPMASKLQTQYRLGPNPNPCSIRHKETTFGHFARSDFGLRVLLLAFRVYFPVQISARILAHRHAQVRSKPMPMRLRRLGVERFRSAAYYTLFVYLCWALSC
ncbi:hypothetical protein CCR75_005267 [Bremia lactucae]|uniref:Uncharacterized protein n=1 Tax=Bremia lactucae TaxID=4779 RepID=A0A976FLH4_BRELC|nr:hypothetical protein CCR75_005267 [Bremia lactucae]